MEIHQRLASVRGRPPLARQIKPVARLTLAVVCLHAAYNNLYGYCCQALF